MKREWMGFKDGIWSKEVNVIDFIKRNYISYDGDESFLAGPTKKTLKVLKVFENMCKEEVKKHVIDIDVDHPAAINAFKPGYICKEDDVIVGLQTDKLGKRAIVPKGGMKMIYQELDAYGYKLNPSLEKFIKETNLVKTHNDGVFDAYTDEIRKARHVKLLTGLPDAYGRGRIIGDYRRIALYGIDFLMADKKNDWDNMIINYMDDETIRLRDKLFNLNKLKVSDLILN